MTMATLSVGPVTQTQLQSAGWTLVSGNGERVQLWTGALDDGYGRMVVWDSVSGRKRLISGDATDDIPSDRAMFPFQLAVVLDDLAKVSSLPGPEKQALRDSIRNLVKAV